MTTKLEKFAFSALYWRENFQFFNLQMKKILKQGFLLQIQLTL